MFYAYKLKLTPQEIKHYLPESTIGLSEDCVPGRKMIKINE